MDKRHRCYYYLGGDYLSNSFREELKKEFPKIKFHFATPAMMTKKPGQYNYPFPYFCKISVPRKDRDKLLLTLVCNAEYWSKFRNAEREI